MKKESNTFAINDEAPEISGDQGSKEMLYLQRRIKGLLLFRLSLAIFFLVLTLAVQGQRAGHLFSAQLRPLYYFSIILLFFTIFAALSLKHVRHLRGFAYLQLFFDVEAVTTLIFFSGGVESIFSFLYMPVIVSAAILLFRRGSMIIASACALSYGLLLDLQYFQWIVPLQVVGDKGRVQDSGTYFLTLLMSIVGFYLVAYLGGYLAEELQRSSRQIRENWRDFRDLKLLHRSIVESVSSGLLTVSQSGYIVFSNRSAQKLLNLSAEQIEGRPLKTIFPELDARMRVLTSLPSGYQERGPVLEREEIIYQSPSGENVCLGYTLSPLRRATGEMWGWVFTFQDLTHVKAMQEEIKRVERSAFAGMVAEEIAHEIKNPLAAISGAVQMLQSEVRDDPFHAKLMKIMHREIERIDELITDFLWLARGSSKAAKVEEVSLCEVIDEIIINLRDKNKVKEEHTITRVFEEAPSFLINRGCLRQILWHPMINAVEAMPDGGELTVRIHKEDSTGQCVMVVDIQDSGSGISPEILGKIFDPFFTTKTNSTGLGLSIVNRLMEHIGGRISVHSLKASGACISLFFPSSICLPLAK